MDNQAVKKDNGKAQLNLVPLEILEPLARVREFAVKKYGMDGIEAWREISEDRLLAAMLRHTVAYQKNHDAIDEESGLPAIYHVAINGAFLAVKTAEREEIEKKETPKTMLQDYLEKHPNAPMFTEGYPQICPQKVGYDEKGTCAINSGEASNCIECWNRPMMTHERKEEFDKSVEKSVNILLGRDDEETPEPSQKSKRMFWRW